MSSKTEADKISPHLIVICAIFKRENLEEFYRLTELMARHAGRFDEFSVERLVDHGMVSCVQFRMLGSMKRESGVPPRLMRPGQHVLHLTTLAARG